MSKKNKKQDKQNKKQIKKSKRKWIGFLIVLSFVCIILDGIGAYVAFFAPDKLVNVTVSAENLTTTDGTTLKPIIELNYFENKTETGVEAFEIKLNSFVNTEDTDYNTYSTGLQLINPEFSYKSLYNTYGWSNINTYIDILPNCEEYDYNSDSNVSYTATDNINKSNQAFIITLNNEKYLMKFKEFNHNDPDKQYFLSLFLNNIELNHFYDYNIYYLSNLLFNAVKSLPVNTSGYVTFKFGDLFDYYTLSGEKLGENGALKVITSFNNFYTIKYTTSQDGLSDSENSLFGAVRYKSPWNLYGSTGLPFDYSKTLITLTEKQLNYTEISNGYYNYGISQEILNEYAGQNILFYIVIDRDILSDKGIVIIGPDDTITESNVYKIEFVSIWDAQVSKDKYILNENYVDDWYVGDYGIDRWKLTYDFSQFTNFYSVGFKLLDMSSNTVLKTINTQDNKGEVFELLGENYFNLNHSYAVLTTYRYIDENGNINTIQQLKPFNLIYMKSSGTISVSNYAYWIRLNITLQSV